MVSEEIARENKIKQTLVFKMVGHSELHTKFLSMLSDWLQKNGMQTIEGNITRLNINYRDSWSGDIDVEIETVKEDRLTLIEQKK